MDIKIGDCYKTMQPWTNNTNNIHILTIIDIKDDTCYFSYNILYYSSRQFNMKLDVLKMLCQNKAYIKITKLHKVLYGIQE